MKTFWERLFNIFSELIAKRKKSIFTKIPGCPSIELVSYYDEFITYYPECELETKRWCVENFGNNWTILDCGANIGYYTILFAQLAPRGMVYAFEPTSTSKMLLENLKYHRIKNVKVERMALGNKIGLHEDNIFRIWGNPPDRKKYSFTTIDKFVLKNSLDRVDCIKIDVDSFDFEVLQGAILTLKEFDPWVIVEVNETSLGCRKQDSHRLLEWVLNRGYIYTEILDNENFVLKREDSLGKLKLPLATLVSPNKSE